MGGLWAAFRRCLDNPWSLGSRCWAAHGPPARHRHQNVVCVSGRPAQVLGWNIKVARNARLYQERLQHGVQLGGGENARGENTLIHVDFAGKLKRQNLRNYGRETAHQAIGGPGIPCCVRTLGVAEMCTQKTLLGTVRHGGQLGRQRQQNNDYTLGNGPLWAQTTQVSRMVDFARGGVFLNKE